MKTVSAPRRRPAEPPSPAIGAGGRPRRTTRRSVVLAAATLSIVVGTGFFTAGSLGDPPAGEVRPPSLTGPAGGSQGAAAPGPQGEAGRAGADTARPAPLGTGAAGNPAGTRAMTDRKGVAALPGLGPKTRARIPAHSQQVLIATGRGPDSYATTVVLWQRDDDNLWRPGQEWKAHNGRRGWSHKHYLGDLRSPVGVFTLSDAGGRDPDPGTELPYHRSQSFHITGTGFLGEPLEGTFDHVVAIDYNRVPGRSPLDQARPMGLHRGGGIWLHVDHGGPTQGCITLARKNLVKLMRTLDLDDHPVIVMGDRASLRR